MIRYFNQHYIIIPPQIKLKTTQIQINKHHPQTLIQLNNTPDTPIQLPSHFHFFQPNKPLPFHPQKPYANHLHIPPPPPLRFEPPDQNQLQLLQYARHPKIFRYPPLVNADIDEERVY
ncbi:urease subunit beta, partial [Staphylococcus capitis]|uniref:urease subunit beta n=1 Tax=Staphylococcus capitis TaxID=29388 RepID=UPI0011A70D51